MITTKVQQILKEKELYFEVSLVRADIIAVNVEWGDWKHDHAYLNYIMRENGFQLLTENVTETDGSDCYSALHIYSIVNFKG